MDRSSISRIDFAAASVLSSNIHPIYKLANNLSKSAIMSPYKYRISRHQVFNGGRILTICSNPTDTCISGLM